MMWLEIIRVRSAEADPGLLEEFLHSMPEIGRKERVEIRTYRHAALVGMDWSLHLRWESEPRERRESDLGLRLAQILRELGMVDHSVWIEQA